MQVEDNFRMRKCECVCHEGKCKQKEYNSDLERSNFCVKVLEVYIRRSEMKWRLGINIWKILYEREKIIEEDISDVEYIIFTGDSL